MCWTWNSPCHHFGSSSLFLAKTIMNYLPPVHPTPIHILPLLPHNLSRIIISSCQALAENLRSLPWIHGVHFSPLSWTWSSLSITPSTFWFQFPAAALLTLSLLLVIKSVFHFLVLVRPGTLVLILSFQAHWTYQLFHAVGADAPANRSLSPLIPAALTLPPGLESISPVLFPVIWCLPCALWLNCLRWTSVLSLFFYFSAV